MIKVSLDGGATWQEVSEVRIEAPDDPDVDYTQTFTATDEGVIQDVWAKGGDQENLHTGCILWEDMIPKVDD